MTPSTARALAIDAARPIVRAAWPTHKSVDRIASECELSAGTVRKLAAEMGLPERAAGGNRRTAMGRVA